LSESGEKVCPLVGILSCPATDADQLVREAIVETLVPGGLLAPLIGGRIRDFATVAEQHRAAGRLAGADLTTLVRYYAPLVQEYIDAGRRIDAELVARAVAIFHERRGELSIRKLR